MTQQQYLRDRRILVVDDHRNIRVSLKLTLESEGAIVDEAENCAQARIKLGDLKAGKDALPYHCIFLDIRMPDGNGLDVLAALKEANLSNRVIMISGEGTLTEAFQATQLGAFDYIEKPFTPERILVSIRRCVEFNFLQHENEQLQRKLARGHEILGKHQTIKEVQTLIGRVAPTNGRVLILGESGTGKELVARAIHRQSQRANKPLIKVNCAAIPHSLIESELFGHEKGAFTGAVKQRRGLFEQADGGTLFLDEIGELSLDVQAKLLRVLQSGELNRIGSEKIITVDVRVIAATHRNLSEMVADNAFREDLYYRLNVVTISVPALRERSTDIGLLAKFFLEEACQEHSTGTRTFSEQAIKQLSAHAWPGNIRELKNIVERTAILSEHEVIEHVEGLKPVTAGATNGKNATATTAGDDNEFNFGCGMMTWEAFHGEIDKAFVTYVLQKAGGNVSEASRLLCLERAYLHRLMKKLGIQRDVVVSN